MELRWPIKLRIAAAAIFGVFVTGFLCWPMVRPQDLLSTVSFASGNLTALDILVVISLATLTGFGGYFISWPYGKHIAVLSVPAGIAFWCIRAGSVAGVLKLDPGVEWYREVLNIFRWEGFVWMLVVGAGFLGVFAASKLKPSQEVLPVAKKDINKKNVYINQIIALGVSCLIALFCINFLARASKEFDTELGTVFSQPAKGQIIFAVIAAFGVCGFVCKKVLDVSYHWPSLASCLLIGIAVIVYGRTSTTASISHLIGRWPIVFYLSPVMSISPAQMVSFGVIGSVAGFWAALRYEYWRMHEN